MVLTTDFEETKEERNRIANKQSDPINQDIYTILIPTYNSQRKHEKRIDECLYTM